MHENRAMPVTSNYQALYDRWRAADAAARVAEQAIATRLLQAIDSGGHPPGTDAWDESKRLRREAEAALRFFMEAVDVERRRHGKAESGSAAPDRRGKDDDSPAAGA
jgi:hypothetical protein